MRARMLLLTALPILAAGCAEQPEDAKSLQARLLAPCCYKQTLDVHASELASSVRDQIQRRMGEGATAAEVESELVRQYGARIRAVPNRGFLDPVAWSGLAAGAIALVLVVGVGLRLRHRAVPSIATASVSQGDRMLLEEELSALE